MCSNHYLTIHPGATPLVSVIIPTYNGARFLSDAIDSALNQTYSRVEVIVVDDGCTDETPQITARYADRITCVRQENAGTAAARNTGIQHSSGELIALLDHDDRWLPHKLERQVCCFAADADVGMVHTGGRVFDFKTGVITSEFVARPLMDAHDLLAWCQVACASTMFRRASIAQIGMFDPDLRGTDDWDMWIRIATFYKVVGCQEILTELRNHDGNQGANAERMFHNALKVLDKHPCVHDNCSACIMAVHKARAELHAEYYARLCQTANAAKREGRYGSWIALRMRAIRHNPAALKRIPQHIMLRIARKSNV